MEEWGKVAYEAYGDSVEWLTVSGEPMPAWEDQQPRLRLAWNVAAQAVAQVAGGEDR